MTPVAAPTPTPIDRRSDIVARRTAALREHLVAAAESDTPA